MTLKEEIVRKPRILVIGDILLDEWVYGNVNRLSPEAPIPILDVKRSIKALGGAGNVLSNLKSLGADPMIISGISEDDTGHEIKKLVRNICEDDVFYFNIPESFKKKRICEGQHQIVRIDYGKGTEITPIEIDEYFGRLKEKVDIVLISDYGKGTVTEYMIYKASQFCLREKIKLLIDPYIKDYYLYNNFCCTMIKLNKSEAEEFSGIKILKENDINVVGDILMDMFNTNSILITLGPDGMAYFDVVTYRKRPYRIIDDVKKIIDVCGAGDSVFSTLAITMLNNMNLYDILKYTIKAGSLAVSKSGTSVVTYKELFN